MAAEAGCPPVHVTSDVTASFLAHPPPHPKALLDRQLSFGGHYARSDDDVLLAGAGNDYFHQNRRHQFRQVATTTPPRHHQQLPASNATQVSVAFTGTCHPDVEHIYESPNHDRPRTSSSMLSVTGRQPDDVYCCQHTSNSTAS